MNNLYRVEVKDYGDLDYSQMYFVKAETPDDAIRIVGISKNTEKVAVLEYEDYETIIEGIIPFTLVLEWEQP